MTAVRLGTAVVNGQITKSATNCNTEKFVLFQLSDALSVKKNYIPAMLLDQFQIQLGLTSAQNFLVPTKFSADADPDQPTYKIVLEQVEMFIYYYPASIDDC